MLPVFLLRACWGGIVALLRENTSPISLMSGCLLLPPEPRVLHAVLFSPSRFETSERSGSNDARCCFASSNGRICLSYQFAFCDRIKSAPSKETRKERNMEQDLQNQLLRTLERSDAYQALRQVVFAWKASGMSQQAVLNVFEQVRPTLSEQETKEELLLDVMDGIVGYCAPSARFFEPPKP